MNLNAAITFMHSIPLPTLRYQQVIHTNNIYEDMAYSKYLCLNNDHETLQIRFPPECISVENIQNDRSYKMVYYKRFGDSVTEITIDPQTFIRVEPDTHIIVYLRAFQHMRISFELTLRKPQAKL